MSFRSFASAVHWKLKAAARRILGSSVDERYFRSRTPEDVKVGLTNLDLPHRPWLVSNLIQAIGNQPDPNILEIGCGWGPNLWKLAGLLPRATLTGIDISPASIALGRSTAERLCIDNVTLVEGEASRFPGLESRSVDVLFTDATLLYLGPDRIRKCLLEFGRVCRGRIVLLEMHEAGADPFGYYTRDGWVRDYQALAARVIPDARCSIELLPKELRPVGRWPSFGALVQLDVRSRIDGA